MGYLSQASASVTNSPKLTISMWVQFTEGSDISTSEVIIPILEFGRDYGTAFVTNNGIRYRNSSGGAGLIPLIEASFNGPDFNLNIQDYWTGSAESSFYDGTVAVPAATHGATYLHVASAQCGYKNNYPDGVSSDPDFVSAIAPGNWFHLYISCDFSIVTGQTLELGDTPYKIVNFLINGRDMTGGINSNSEPAASPPVGSCQTYLQTVTNGQGLFVATSQFEADPIPFQTFIPASDIGINGFEFAIPTKVANFSANTNGIRYSDTQIWVGQYIDPTVPANLAKFIDADGKPVNPAVAAAAFGEPTYYLKGPSSGIASNGGSGGNFVKTGTVTDYTPGP